MSQTVSYGQTVGTRALMDQLRTQAYCNGKAQAGFASEQFSTIDAKELDDLVKTIDQATADKKVGRQRSKYRLELSDVYCLRRDLRYSMRSRKWLFTKAQGARLDTGLAGWVTFVHEHLDVKAYLKSLISKSVLELGDLTFTKVMTTTK